VPLRCTVQRNDTESASLFGVTPVEYDECMPKSADMRALGGFAASHHGTFTSSQAACNGVSRNDLVRLQRDGSVIRIRRGVYRLAAHPVSWRQASYASTLAVRSAASHRSAGALHGSDGVSPPARPDIACHHHAAVDLPDVTSHRTSWLPKSDVTEIDGIPCTTLIRTIIDLAGIVDDATLIRIVDDAQRRRIDMSCLLQQATMMLATGRSGPSNVIDIVRRRLDGYSVPESSFERLLSMGLRSPALKGIVRQHELRTPTGLFVARFDLAVPAVRLGIEGHSRSFHLGEAVERYDENRDMRAGQLIWQAPPRRSENGNRPRLRGCRWGQRATEGGRRGMIHR
jgi:hypothetical protein